MELELENLIFTLFYKQEGSTLWEVELTNENDEEYETLDIAVYNLQEAGEGDYIYYLDDDGTPVVIYIVSQTQWNYDDQTGRLQVQYVDAIKRHRNLHPAHMI